MALFYVRILFILVWYLSEISSQTDNERYIRVKRRNYEILNYLVNQGHDFWKNEILLDHLILSQFTWKNCGTSKDPLQLHKLTLAPDPLKLPGNVNISFLADLADTVVAPLKAEVQVHKHIGIWVKIPCVDNIGSCTYEDICAMLVKPCPDPFIKYNIPCSCPVKQASYFLPPSEIFLNPLHIPSSLLSGYYKIDIKLSQQGAQVGCYQFLMSLRS